MAAVEAVELGTGKVLGAFADAMAYLTFLERLLAGGHVLRLRRLRHRGHGQDQARYRKCCFHRFLRSLLDVAALGGQCRPACPGSKRFCQPSVSTVKWLISSG